MSLANLNLWLHLVTAVFLVGYSLFWTIVAVPHADRPDTASQNAFLDELRRGKWPPFGPVRLPLMFLGWLGLAAMAITGWIAMQGDAEPANAKLVAFGFAVLLHVPLSLRPRPAAIYAFQLALLATVVLAVVPTPAYRGVLFAVHLLAVMIWLGHMFFWSFVVGPLVKRLQPEERREAVRETSLRWGAMGGAALFVLLFTGTMILIERGEGLGAIPWKLGLVGAMALYQMTIGHRRAPRLIYANMLVALVILALSVSLVHRS